ncbi:MgtC/SapB family protein [Sulfitobacter sp. F26169L]|uniref:MgtC/SapB family protein n=1 Tax=Sulfitobacter sp. F26169L TaxID=2996015 RepID=UPI002260B854|nr:MgtC/SapB family protein [Sulfitobacter sp. F26169L]
MELFTFSTLGLSDLLLRLTAATLLPLAIGLERYFRSKPIDFRPFVVISVVSCGIMIATSELIDQLATEKVPIDPTRVMQGVITGIGFLGAGAMFRDGNFIKGAGTAASIWSAGVIGLLCGLGQTGISLILTAIVLSFMVFSAPFTDKWDNDLEQ